MQCDLRTVRDLVGQKGEGGPYFNGKPLEDLKKRSNVVLISVFRSSL